MVGKVQMAALVVAVIVIGGVMAFLLVPQSVDEDETYAPWPMFGGSPQHNGRSPYLVDGTPLELEWMLEFEGQCHIITMGPEDKIYFVHSDEGYDVDSIYCLDANGTVNWTVEYYRGYASIFTSPTIGPDLNIYIGNNDSVLCYLPDGELNWSRNVGKTHDEPWLTVAEDHIYVFSGEKLSSYSLNGSKEWELDLEQDSRTQSVPSVSEDGTIYIAYCFDNRTGGFDKSLQAVNPDGSIKWNVSLARECYHSGMWFTPIIGNDGTIYVHNDEDAIVAVASDGRILWEFPVDVMNCFAYAIGEDGAIYISENGYEGDFSYIHAINPNGELDWTFKIYNGTIISSIVTCKDGTILFSCMDGVHALNQDGKEMWVYDVQGMAGSIVIGEEGTLYFMVWDFEAMTTNLYAIR